MHVKGAGKSPVKQRQGLAKEDLVIVRDDLDELHLHSDISVIIYMMVDVTQLHLNVHAEQKNMIFHCME